MKSNAVPEGAKRLIDPLLLQWEVYPYQWVDLFPINFYGFRVSRCRTSPKTRRAVLRYQRMRS
jgi:hypothetical protein